MTFSQVKLAKNDEDKMLTGITVRHFVFQPFCNSKKLVSLAETVKIPHCN